MDHHLQAAVEVVEEVGVTGMDVAVVAFVMEVAAAAHLSDANFEAAAALLEGKGFRYVSGGYGAYLSEWQHVNGT